MATHPSILAWRIPWMAEPGGPHGATKSTHARGPIQQSCSERAIRESPAGPQRPSHQPDCFPSLSPRAAAAGEPFTGGLFPGEAKTGDPPPSHSDGRFSVLWLSSALRNVGSMQVDHVWGTQSQCRPSVSRWGGRWCWCFAGSPAAPMPCLCQPSPSPWALPGTPGSALSSPCLPPAPWPGAVVSHLLNQPSPAREAA